MKVLHLNTSKNGGAAKAANRIHTSVMKLGIDSIFLSKDDIDSFKYPNENNLSNLKYTIPDLTLKNYIDEKFFRRFTKQKLSIEKKRIELKKKLNPLLIGDFEICSTPFSEVDITLLDAYKQADIIHLHWIAGLVDFETFFIKNQKPIIWTLHDENPFRGLFHYENDQIRNENKFRTLNEKFLKIKTIAYKNVDNMIVITPSNWLKDKAIFSNVFSNTLFYQQNYAINTDVFKPICPTYSKSIFNIPSDKKVVVFVSEIVSNYRKGYDLLSQMIYDHVFEDVIFLIVGDVTNKAKNAENIIYTGKITDERLMSVVYNAGDFFILPSREDNQPNTMIEALCCGTPVIAFDISDNRSILEPDKLGVVCESIDVFSLKKTLMNCLNNQYTFNRNRISEIASGKFSENACGNFYKEIYEKLFK